MIRMDKSTGQKRVRSVVAQMVKLVVSIWLGGVVFVGMGSNRGSSPGSSVGQVLAY